MISDLTNVSQRCDAFYVCLPASSQLPRECRTLTIAPYSAPLAWQRKPFHPKSVILETYDKECAWSTRIISHQYLLFLSILTVEACESVTFMVERTKWNAATLWLRRANRLLSGYVRTAADTQKFDQKYLKSVSSTSIGRLELCDWRSSPERRSLEDSIRRMEEAMGSKLCSFRELTDARKLFDKSNQKMSNLRCLLPYQYSKDASLGLYDSTIGVLRVPRMFIEEFAFFLSCTAEAMRLARDNATSLALSVQETTELMQAIVGELLDPPTYKPNA